MAKYIAFFFGVACFFLGGCSREEGIHFFYKSEMRYSSFPYREDNQIRLLRERDAAADAFRAFKSGDHRLVGVQGLVLDIPGIEANALLVGSVGVKIITGTGDGIGVERGDDINTLSRRYASTYNYRMIVLLTGGLIRSK